MPRKRDLRSSSIWRFCSVLYTLGVKDAQGRLCEGGGQQPRWEPASCSPGRLPAVSSRDRPHVHLWPRRGVVSDWWLKGVGTPALSPLLRPGVRAGSPAAAAERHLQASRLFLWIRFHWSQRRPHVTCGGGSLCAVTAEPSSFHRDLMACEAESPSQLPSKKDLAGSGLEKPSRLWILWCSHLRPSMCKLVSSSLIVSVRVFFNSFCHLLW